MDRPLVTQDDVLKRPSSSVASNYGSTEPRDIKGLEEQRSFKDSPAFKEHLGKHRQYWRDIILGVNDGLISTFLLVAGVAGGGLASIDILLTGIAGGLAGAVSMFAGEFIATKSQDEVLRGEIALEERHVYSHRDSEVEELKELLDLIGISGDDQPDLRGRLVSFYEQNPEALLKIMVALEFGVVEEERRSPWLAGVTSCVCFFLGSLPSIIPFAVTDHPYVGLASAAIVTGLALMGVGAIKTWATRGSWLVASVENLLVGVFGGGFAYGVGRLFDRLVHD